MDPGPAAPGARRLLQGTTALNRQAGVLLSRHEGSETTITVTAAAGIEEAMAGCQQPQGRQQQSEHDPYLIHHPLDASQIKVINARAACGCLGPKLLVAGQIAFQDEAFQTRLACRPLQNSQAVVTKPPDFTRGVQPDQISRPANPELSASLCAQDHPAESRLQA
jgi:hypothetical protein